jgi:hypothetical protein
MSRYVSKLGSMLLLLLLLLASASCIMVPNLAKRRDEERVTTRLQVGVSTRQDVRKVLDRPIEVGEHMWAHEWHTKEGWIIVGGGYSAATAPMGTRGYRALTTFDDADILESLEIIAEPKRSDIREQGAPAPMAWVDLPGCHAFKACHYVSLSRNGRWAAGRCGRHNLRHWDLEVPDTEHAWQPPGMRDPFAFAPTGDLVAVATKGGVWLWRPDQSGEIFHPVAELSGRLGNPTFSSDGALIAVAGKQGVRVYDVESWNLQLSFDAQHGVTDLEFSPDGSLLAVMEWDTVAWVVEMESGAVLGSLTMGCSRAGKPRMSFSPDGSLLAINHGSYVGIIGIGALLAGVLEEPEVWLLPFGTGKWATTGRLIGLRPELDFSPDGSLLALVSDRGTSVWRLSDRSLLAELPHQSSVVSDIAFTEDGTRLLVAGTNRVCMWNLPSVNSPRAPLNSTKNAL